MKILKPVFGILLWSCWSLMLVAQTGNFRQLSIQEGLVQSQVRGFVQDQRDFMWIATWGGLTIYDGTEYEYITKENGLKDNAVQSLFKQSDGTIWIGSLNHIAYYDGKTVNAFAVSLDTFGINNGLDYRFFEYKKQLYLIKSGCLFRKDKDAFVPLIARKDLHLVNGYFIDGDQLYLLLVDKGIMLYEPEQRKLSAVHDPVPGMLFLYVYDKDKDKGVYKVHTNQGLYDFNIRERRFERDAVLSRLSHGKMLYSYYRDKKRNEWLSTSDGGVYHIRQDGEVLYYNAASGFSSMEVFNIREDNQDNVWLSTNGDGIFRYNYGPFFFYEKNKFFNGELITDVRYLSGQKKLYIATHKGTLYETAVGTVLDFKIRHHFPGILNLDEDRDGTLLILTPASGVYALEKGRVQRRILGIKESGSLWAYAVFEDLEAILLTNKLMIKRNGAWEKSAFLPVQGGTVLRFVDREHIAIGTQDGVALVNITSHRLTRTIARESSIYDIIVHDKLLYIATDDRGLLIYGLEDGAMKVLDKTRGLSCNFVYNMMLEGDELWLGTGCGIDKLHIKDAGQYRILNYSTIYGWGAIEANGGAIEKAGSQVFMGANYGLYHINTEEEYLSDFTPKIILKDILVFSQHRDLSGYSDEHLYNGLLPLNPVFPAGFTHLTFNVKSVMLGVDKIRYRYELEGGSDGNVYETEQSQIVFTNLSPGKYRLKVWSTNSYGQWGETYYYYDFEIQTPFYQSWYFRVAVLFFGLSLYFLVLYYLNRLKNRRKEREERLKLAEQDRVKQRTAEDFHDEIGNKLTKINLLSSMARSKAGDAGDIQDILGQLQYQTQSLYKGAKDIIWSLQPQSNYLHEIVDRMVYNAEEMVQLSGIALKVERIFCDDMDMDRYNAIKTEDEVSRNMILIFKEIFNNITKYSRASAVTFNIRISDQQLICRVTDNGVGFDMLQDNKLGNGLNNIRRRAGRIHAHLQILSAPGKGTEIIFLMELNPGR